MGEISLRLAVLTDLGVKIPCTSVSGERENSIILGLIISRQNRVFFYNISEPSTVAWQRPYQLSCYPVERHYILHGEFSCFAVTNICDSQLNFFFRICTVANRFRYQCNFAKMSALNFMNGLVVNRKKLLELAKI